MSAFDALVMTDENGGTQIQQNVEAGRVKFTKDNESIDVSGERKLIGLTKEQLERYRNDPLWKPIRYTLFALFWLVWIGMFAGAILIVVLSPKCAAKKDKHWAENAVIYQLYTPTFRDLDGDGVGDFNGVKEKLNELRRVGATAVWPTPLLTTNKDEFEVAQVKDAMNVDPRFGTEDDLKMLIKRAHDLDLPLTISTSNPQAAKQGIGGTEKVRLLNLAIPSVVDVVKETAAKLIALGVDGLNFAQYGIKYPTGSVDAARLDNLARAIRTENTKNVRNGDPNNLIFIASTPIDRPNRSINFYSRSLGRFVSTTDVCSASADFIECLKESALTGVQQIKRNSSSPLWQFGDVSHARVDSLFGKSENLSASQAASLATAVQLFLPGAVKIYYGEELSLPSVNQSLAPQLGLMQWDDSNTGFTDNKEQLFFKGLPETLAKELNFKVFKKLASLRVRDEVFTDGEYIVGRVEGLHVFVRTLAGNDKAYLLVVNWPTLVEKSAKQFTVAKVVSPFKIKIAKTAELLIDHPVNKLNEWHIETETKLQVEPYEFLVVRVTVST